MLKEKKRIYKRKESGAITLEAVVVLCVLFFAFFSFLQIWNWAIAKNFCHYAAYYAAKAMGLGYKINFARRAARVAAIPISGASRGSYQGNEKLAAQEYMSRGDGSGVWYTNWYPQRAKDPEIHLNGHKQNEGFYTRVTLRHAPLLHEAIGKIMSLSENPYPSETVDFYDYGKIYIDE